MGLIGGVLFSLPYFKWPLKFFKRKPLWNCLTLTQWISEKNFLKLLTIPGCGQKAAKLIVRQIYQFLSLNYEKMLSLETTISFFQTGQQLVMSTSHITLSLASCKIRVLAGRNDFELWGFKMWPIYGTHPVHTN